jgi:hypothetical protein
MEKKEFPKTEGDFSPKDLGAEPSGGLRSKIAGFSSKVFSVIKLILGICLLPFVYSSTISFLNELGRIEKPLQNQFWSGIISLLIIYLFIWEPAVIYSKGHKILEIIFNFFKPLLRVAPYILPIYTILVFLLYQSLSMAITSGWLIRYTVFALGFTLALHLVFSAKSIRGKKSDFLKANYIFGFSFVYIINVILLALCLNLLFKEFSLVNFFNVSFQTAKNILAAVFNQLFLNKTG